MQPYTLSCNSFAQTVLIYKWLEALKLVYVQRDCFIYLANILCNTFDCDCLINQINYFSKIFFSFGYISGGLD